MATQAGTNQASRIKFDKTALRLARLRAGLTQEQLARQLDVTVRSVQHWELDTGVPNGGNLRRLAGLLGVSTAELYVISDETEREAA